MTRYRRFLVVTALVVAMAGCGSGSGDDDSETATFRDDEFGITFEYPEDFEPGDVTNVERQAGGSATARRGFGIDDDNAIFVTRFELTAVVSEDNIDAVQDELDGVMRDLVDAEVTGRRTDIAGFIGFQYDDLAVTPPENGQSDITFVFDGDVQYQLNCQSTPEQRARVDDACQLAIDTLAAA